MAAALRSSVGLALRRAAAAPPASSRLSSAGAASACARVKQGTRHYGNYDGSRSMFDPEAYSRNPVPANPELGKFDLLFGVTAFTGMILFGCLMDGEGFHYFWWCKEGNASRQPRMSSRRSRR